MNCDKIFKLNEFKHLTSSTWRQLGSLRFDCPKLNTSYFVRVWVYSSGSVDSKYWYTVYLHCINIINKSCDLLIYPPCISITKEIWKYILKSLQIIKTFSQIWKGGGGMWVALWLQNKIPGENRLYRALLTRQALVFHGWQAFLSSLPFFLSLLIPFSVSWSKKKISYLKSSTCILSPQNCCNLHNC